MSDMNMTAHSPPDSVSNIIPFKRRGADAGRDDRQRSAPFSPAVRPAFPTVSLARRDAELIALGQERDAIFAARQLAISRLQESLGALRDLKASSDPRPDDPAICRLIEASGFAEREADALTENLVKVDETIWMRQPTTIEGLQVWARIIWCLSEDSTDRWEALARVFAQCVLELPPGTPFDGKPHHSC